MKLGVLASGDLGLKCIQALPDFVSIECVFTDSGSTAIIDWCKQNKIALFTGNPRAGKTKAFISQLKVDVLFSINYIFIIENDLINWAKYAFNIHGSLLPRYRGRTPHVWAIINNETETGLTVHLIDEGCDTGRIVLQKNLPIEKCMTGYDVLKRFRALYPEAISETLLMVKNKLLNPLAQDDTRATYFGKRTPDDGLIDWEWQKERIYNWVRAQAKPYPGAFTFYGEHKMIIHKVEPDQCGFHYNDVNGTIIELIQGQPVVKTPNGALRIVEFEMNANIELRKGEVLHG